MIKKLLDGAILEVILSRYEITEFQLGKNPMELLIIEAKEDIAFADIKIEKINSYKGVRIISHESENAIMYCIQPKSMKNEKD